MNNGVVREIVYEDDEVVAYADYDLAGDIITLGTLLSVITMFIFITIARSLAWI